MTANLKSSNWIWLGAIVALWFLEVGLVQEYTLQPYFKTYASWIGKHATRWSLDFLVILLIVNFLPRRLVVLVMLLSCLFSILLLTYFEHFHAPLSEQVMLSQSSEATEFSGYALDVINWKFTLALLALFGLKVLILLKAKGVGHALAKGSSRFGGWGRKKLVKLVLVLGSIGLISGISMYNMPPRHQLAMFDKWTIYAEAYGYLPAWALNYYYNRDPALLLNKALELSKPTPDYINFKTPVKADNIAIIQFESLDFPMLNLKYAENTYVMPFLNSLLASSLLYKVKYDYSFGTATADFELVTGLVPGGDRIPYKVAGFPFKDVQSLARIGKEKGFISSVLHGNHGFFYGREDAFKDVGFDQVFFTKEMVEEGTPLYKEYVLDEDTFQFGLKKFSAPKNLQFIITMTSHGPWDYQPEDKNEIYSQPKNSIENYFNAIRYLDNSLKNYVEGLPDNTIIFMFGDHVSAQKYENHELGVVPFLVYQKGQVLRFSNKAEQQKALSGELLRSDLIGGIYKYLRDY